MALEVMLSTEWAPASTTRETFFLIVRCGDVGFEIMFAREG